MNNTNPGVQFITIDAEQDGQRIDNFLKTQLKGVPKSLIYRILRKGEVRVNKKNALNLSINSVLAMRFVFLLFG